jgi:type IV pilus assembly protein PilQ
VTDAAVSVTDHGTVTLAAQGIDITKLLELLSIKSHMNIVASEKVKAQVSVSLYDVPIDQALDALLTVNGFVWERQGPFVMVYTRAEKEAMDKALKKVCLRVFINLKNPLSKLREARRFICSAGGLFWFTL